MKVFMPSALGRGVRIRATGSRLPDRVVTNADLVAAGAPLTADEMFRLSASRRAAGSPTPKRRAISPSPRVVTPSRARTSRPPTSIASCSGRCRRIT